MYVGLTEHVFYIILKMKLPVNLKLNMQTHIFIFLSHCICIGVSEKRFVINLLYVMRWIIISNQINNIITNSEARNNSFQVSRWKIFPLPAIWFLVWKDVISVTICNINSSRIFCDIYWIKLNLISCRPFNVLWK